MTRINVVPPAELTREHLIAEYRELPRVFSLVSKHVGHGRPKPDHAPTEYRLGPGHIMFFYDKLAWLAARHQDLIAEMQRRGYVPTMTGSLMVKFAELPAWCWGPYDPTPVAMAVNRQRLAERSGIIAKQLVKEV